jgi:predicted GNAT superfamily acetyltransferase
MEAWLLDSGDSSWPAEVDHLRAHLGAPHNPYLFPPQFVKTIFPGMGGHVAVYREGAAVVGVGFLFPRAVAAGRRLFTLRFHPVDAAAEVDAGEIVRLTEAVLAGDRVVFYDPRQEQQYERTARAVGEGDVELGRPDAGEATAVRALQQTIWHSDPDLLYPADIHSAAFSAGTSLVARQEGRVCAFVFGFYQFGGSPLPEAWRGRIRGELRIESQLLGVSPECRMQGIGFLLKRAQAEQARQQGVDVVHWTVDPLQYANAVLNLGKLRALALRFYPDYYPMRNELNQVAASRLEITWLVGAPRVAQALVRSGGAFRRDLHGDTTVPRVNQGWSQVRLECTEPILAIEAPADWTALQQQDREQALRWREATDALLAHYLGSAEGRYAVAGVGQDGERRYLIAERVGPEMLEWYVGVTRED